MSVLDSITSDTPQANRSKILSFLIFFISFTWPLIKIGIIRKMMRNYLLDRVNSMFVYGKASFKYYSKRYNISKKKIIRITNIIPVTHNINVKKSINNKIRLLKRKQLKMQAVTLHFLGWWWFSGFSLYKQQKNMQTFILMKI